MLNLDSIAVDPDKAFNGVWANYQGGQFLVARKGPKYNERLVELYNQNLELIKSGTPEGNLKAVEVFQRVFAETQLLDWKDIVDKDKNPIPYTPELGFKVISDPRQYELTEFLENFAARQANYQESVEAEVAEDVKDTAVS